MKNSPLVYRNVLLAEHVIKGEGNKYTIVSVFSGDVVCPSFPFEMMLQVFVEIVPCELGNISVNFEFRVDGQTSARLEVGGEIVNLSHPWVLALPRFGMAVQTPALLEVIATHKGYKPKTILSKRIILQPAPISPPQPASRLPSAVPETTKKRAKPRPSARLGAGHPSKGRRRP